MCSLGHLLNLRNDRCGHLISLLQQSSAPAINFVLEVSKETKLQFTHLTNSSYSIQRPNYLLPQHETKFVLS